ncbi:MAG: hypothetical protein HY753_03205 [Nitrospirae bacterium]|nr:hypothetical protein [Nitrospirota bacterium]
MNNQNRSVVIFTDLLVLSLFLLFLPLQVECDDKKNPYFISEMWPEEGRPGLRAKINLHLRTEPRKNAPLVNGIIKKGEIINFTSTRHMTIRPKEIVVSEDMVIPDATSYGKLKYLSVYNYYNSGKTVRLILKKGKKIKILQYRAEGTYLLEYDSNIYGAECSICTEKTVPETEWWVMVNEAGTQGWILINDQNVQFMQYR